MRDCSFQFSVAADIRDDAARQLRQKYDADRLEDVVQSGILYFATSRNAAKLAQTSRENQVHQLVQDCIKAAKEVLGGEFWTIDEDNAWSQKRAKKSVQVVHEMPEIFENHPVPHNERFDEFLGEVADIRLINSLVEFCRERGMNDAVEIMRLKYTGLTDAEVGKRLGLTGQQVQKRLKKVGALYRAELRRRVQKEVRNAKTPAGTGILGESRYYV